MSRDTGVEVRDDVTPLLERLGKRLVVSANDRDGLDFNLVCALCRGQGAVLHFGSAAGFASVRPCPLCPPDERGGEPHG